MRKRYRRAGRAAFSLALAAALWVCPSRADDRGASGTDALAPARALFFDALRDEEAMRFDDALRKFSRVRAVRDTASVEYRIATCYEGLGHAAAAYAAYQASVERGRGDPRAADVVAAAQARMQALSSHVALLTLIAPNGAGPDSEVRVDGAVVPSEAFATPLPLDPGPHVVAAAMRGMKPTRSELVLSEGAHVSFVLPSASRAADASVEGAPSRAVDRLPAWLTLAGGGVLAGAAGVLLGVRSGEIAKLDRACPGGQCPIDADRSDLEATRRRALAEGPIAAALGGAAIVAVGIGVYLALAPEKASPEAKSMAGRAQVLPLIGPGVVGVLVRGSLE